MYSKNLNEQRNNKLVENKNPPRANALGGFLFNEKTYFTSVPLAMPSASGLMKVYLPSLFSTISIIP